jgi:hypothetical protein
VYPKHAGKVTLNAGKRMMSASTAISARIIGRMAPRDLLEFQTADGSDHEEDSAHGRGNQAYGDIQHKAHREIKRVDAELVGQRREHRDQDDDGRKNIDERAADEDEDCNQPHDGHGAGRHAADGLGYGLRDLQDREKPGEKGGHGHNEQGRRRDEGALQKHFRDEMKIELAVIKMPTKKA